MMAVYPVYSGNSPTGAGNGVTRAHANTVGKKRSVLIVVDNLAALVETICTDVVTQVGLAGGRLD